MAGNPDLTSNVFGLASEAQPGTGVRVADTDPTKHDIADREVCRTVEANGPGAAYLVATRVPGHLPLPQFPPFPPVPARRWDWLGGARGLLQKGHKAPRKLQALLVTGGWILLAADTSVHGRQYPEDRMQQASQYEDPPDRERRPAQHHGCTATPARIWSSGCTASRTI